MKLLFVVAFVLLLGTSNPCPQDPCVNGDCSSDVLGKVTCTCWAGWEGTYCDKAIQDPCSQDPCVNGDCSPDLLGKVTCTCWSGWEGTYCDKQIEGCKEETFRNIQTNSASDSTDMLENIFVNVTVMSAELGTMSPTQEKCENEYFGFNTMPLGSAQCGNHGQFERIQVVDCSKDPSELDPVDQLVFAVVATSDPKCTSSLLVDYAVSAIFMYTSSATTINQTEADMVIQIINNIIQVDTVDLSSENRNDILGSIDDLTDKVQLTIPTKRSISTAFYQEVQSHVAIAVAEGSSEIYFAAPAAESSPSTNLVYAGLKLFDSEPTAVPYISATPDSGGKVSFRVYSTYTDLFPSLTDLAVQNTVLSAFGNSTKYNFKFKMLGSRIKLKCTRFNRDTAQWAAQSDCDASVDGNYATCSCATAGEYLLQGTIEENGWLSPSAIAGIVIGSIVGFGLIGGTVYYLAFYKKNGEGSSIGPSDEEEMKAKTIPAANLDDEDD